MTTLQDPPVKTALTYEENAFQWKHHIRVEMKDKIALDENITDFSANQYIVNSTMRLADQRGVMGNAEAMWAIWAERLAFYREDKKSDVPITQRIADYAAAAGMTEQELKSVMGMAFPKGTTNACARYNEIDKRVDAKKVDKTEAIPPIQAADPAPADPPVENELDAALGRAKPDLKPIETPAAASPIDYPEGYTPARQLWAAETKTDTEKAIKSAHNRFLELLKPLKSVIYIDKDIEIALEGETIQSFTELHGIRRTCDALQLYIDKLAGKAETMAKPDAEAWKRWLEEHNWSREDVLAVLNQELEARGVGTIKGLTEWSTLESAEKVVKAAIARREAQPESPEDDEIPDVDPRDDEPPAALSAPAPAPTNIIQHPQSHVPRTIQGISLSDVGYELRKYLSSSAYKAIEEGRNGAGLASIDGMAVRQRFDDVFGVGTWRISALGIASRVDYEWEDRETVVWKDRKVVKNPDGTDKTKLTRWHTCTLQAHTFEYAVIMPSGEFTWVQGFTASSLHSNVNRLNAYNGAMTTLINTFFKLMGGKDLVQGKKYGQVMKEIQDFETAKKKRAG